MYYYNEDHSISIGRFNTWKDWHIIPTSKPSVAPPDVKEEYVEIPGMPGALDYTELLSGRPIYSMRKGKWEFYVPTAYDGIQENADWANTYSQIMDDIHGKKFDRIILEDDPLYYYVGRVKVSDYKSDKERATISIDYTLNPYKTPILTSEEQEWEWNQLFGIKQILYGTFDVVGSKMRTIINSSEDQTQIYTDATYPMVAHIYESETSLIVKQNVPIPAGITEAESQLFVDPGSTKIRFEGTGQIKLYYQKGRRL